VPVARAYRSSHHAGKTHGRPREGCGGGAAGACIEACRQLSWLKVRGKRPCRAAAVASALGQFRPQALFENAGKNCRRDVPKSPGAKAAGDAIGGRLLKGPAFEADGGLDENCFGCSNYRFNDNGGDECCGYRATSPPQSSAVGPRAYVC
jgi:hypothetical protein